MSERAGSHPVGAHATRFRVWAPRPKELELVLPDQKRAIPMQRDAQGWAEVTLDGVGPGERYAYRLDGERVRPDPAGALLPDGVHGAAQVVDLAFGWRDSGFRPPPLRDWSIYELHVGVFSREGTFEGVERALGSLRELGIRAIELMPVAPFPGSRNWGYDGVNLYAVHAAYGGPKGLQKLVDAAHRAELAVVLDVVFNHFGPEGNYHADFMPIFTHAHHTPWGDGINYDGPGSEHVRRFVIDSALRWFEDFHIDALRLDAIHGIIDGSPKHVLAQLGEEVEALCSRTGRCGHLIAESDLGESRVVRARPGGLGMDAQWSDDFHHALHARLTGERHGYYVDFGSTAQVAKALERGYVFEGEDSKFRGGPFGDSTSDLPPEKFVVCAQNHDQVGNRGRGERLGQLVSADKVRLAAAVTLLSPHVPLLFMGEEYGESAPFLYFTSHGDPQLAKAVSEGRRKEFPELEGQEGIPDPQDPRTFERSVLHSDEQHDGAHASLLALHRELLALRRAHPSLGCVPATVSQDGEVVRVLRNSSGEKSLLLLAFDAQESVSPPINGMHLLLDTSDARFGGPAEQGGSGELRPWSAQVWLGRG